jgi:hypothetical protein
LAFETDPPPDQISREPRVLYVLLAAFSGFLCGRLFSKIKSAGQEFTETTYPPNHTTSATRHSDSLPGVPARVIIEALPPASPPTARQQAQARRKNIFEIVGILIALALLIVTSRYAYYAKQQRDAMIRQNEISYDALVRSQRAWIGPSQAIKIDSYDLGPPQIRLQYRVFLKNFGGTVALNVLPTVSAAPGNDRLDAAMRANCQLAERAFKGEFISGQSPPPGGKLGQTIFPTEERRIPYGDGEPSDPKLTVLYIVGCVFYRDQFNITRRTQFCFETPGLAKDFRSSQDLVYCNVYDNAE